MDDLVAKLREAFQRKRYGAGEYDPDFDLFDAAADALEQASAKASAKERENYEQTVRLLEMSCCAVVAMSSRG